MEKTNLFNRICVLLCIFIGTHHFIGCSGIKYDTFKGKDAVSNIEVTVVTKTDTTASYGIDNGYQEYFFEQEFEIKLPNGEIIQLKSTPDDYPEWTILTQDQINKLKEFIPNPDSWTPNVPRVKFAVTSAASYEAVTQGQIEIGDYYSSDNPAIEGLSPITVQRQ